MFKELDTVKLTHNIKEHSLRKGDIGAIVLVYTKGGPYEVEFVKSNGRTKALLTLMSSDISHVTSKANIYYNAPFEINDYTMPVDVKSGKDYKFKSKATRSGERTEEFYYPHTTV